MLLQIRKKIQILVGRETWRNVSIQDSWFLQRNVCEKIHKIHTFKNKNNLSADDVHEKLVEDCEDCIWVPRSEL
jgi:hypothetical protein